jgi:cell pole-organizing protein PopZ
MTNFCEQQPPMPDSYTPLEPSDNSPKTPKHGLDESAIGKPTGEQPPLKQARTLTDVLASMGKLVEERQQAKQHAVIAATQQRAPMTKQSASLPNAASAGQPKMPQKPPQPKLKDDRSGQEQLTRLLSQTYASQQTYGDKAQMMEYRDQMFQMVLEDYPFSTIRQAFIQHVKTSSCLPTPHDIIRLIDPSMEPLSESVYIRISNRMKDPSQWITPDERRYMQRFESRELRKI